MADHDITAEWSESRSTEPAGSDQAERLSPELRRLAGAIMLGGFMVALDMTSVNVALHTLVRDFGTSVTTIQWVTTGYTLALAMVIPVSGWLIERFGARASWIAALSLFIGGSVLCGAAWSALSLIAFRVLQGVGGGMLLPLAQTILAQAAGPKQLPRMMAFIGIPAMLGPVLGPTLGGILVTDVSWRLIFYLNVPVCIVAFIAARRVRMPDTRTPNRGGRLDTLGLALLSPGLAALIYGLAQSGNGKSITDPQVLAPILAGAGLLVVFVLYSLRRRDPIINVRLFRARLFSASSAVVLLFSMASLGITFLMPLYYQQVRGESALQAGLLLAPLGLGLGLGLILGSKLSDQIGPRKIVLGGLVLLAASTVAYTQIGLHTSFVLLSAALVLGGIGNGATLVSCMATPYRAVSQAQIPQATSTLRIIQQLGASFGVAALSVVLQHGLSHHGLASTGAINAYRDAFWWALGFVAIAILPAVLLPTTPIEQDTGQAAPPPQSDPATAAT
jgi:EmrB/QacA subfamily drug resistance transporter